MTTATASYFFAAGYRFYIGSYSGESLAEDFEEIFWALTIEDNPEEEWLYVESVRIDEAAHEVHIFIGNDE